MANVAQITSIFNKSLLHFVGELPKVLPADEAKLVESASGKLSTLLALSPSSAISLCYNLFQRDNWKTAEDNLVEVVAGSMESLLGINLSKCVQDTESRQIVSLHLKQLVLALTVYEGQLVPQEPQQPQQEEPQTPPMFNLKRGLAAMSTIDIPSLMQSDEFKTIVNKVTQSISTEDTAHLRKLLKK
jgi:hypothetical protein